jgi:hypothetical protein
MPSPQLTDRIKEAPAMVLRAIFAGVGQVLLAVDKIRNDVLEHGAKEAGAQPSQPARPPAPPGPAAGQDAATADRGNVRPLRDEPASAAAGTKPAAAPAGPASPAPAAKRTASAKPAAAKAAAAKPAGKPAAGKPASAAPAKAKPAAAKPAAAKPAAAKPAAAAPASAPATAAAAAPLANYDELTIASLRARLRGLDAATVRSLLEYERSHADREAVVSMYERRLEKIASEAR